MGFGLSLIFFFAIGLFLTLLVSVFLKANIGLFFKNYEQIEKIKSVMFKTPFIFYFTLCIGFVCFQFIFSGFTGVDVGFGDSWRLPIDGNYQLIMLDDTKHATVEEQGSQLFHNVGDIGIENGFVYLKIEKDFHVIDLEKRTTEGILEEQVTIRLSSVNKFYSDYFDKKYGLRESFGKIGVLLIALLLSILYIRKSLKRKTEIKKS